MSAISTFFRRFVLPVLLFVARVVGVVVSVVFYVLILGPYAIVLRIARPDLIGMDADEKMESYWNRLPPERPRPDKPF